MAVFAQSTSAVEHLRHAVLLYGTFATVHEVKERDGQPVILPGTLATKDGLIAALRSMLPETERGSGLIPETMLASGIDHMVWWVKPCHRSVWFSCKELGGERSATVPHPGLVMMVTPKGWYVFAVKGKERPGPDTPLYQTPYFNVWEGGKICTGTAKTPKGVHRKKQTAWEDAFFGSYFSHPNIRAPQKLVTKGSGYKFWSDMLEGKYAKFPERMLVDANRTLGAMYAQITKGTV